MNKEEIFNKLKIMGDGMPISIAICNDKGGSAKTTTAINIAEAIARINFSDDWQNPLNLKVLLIDGDDSRTCSIWAKNRELGKYKGNFVVCNEKEAVPIMIKTKPDILIYDTAGGIKTNEMSELADMCNFFILPCKPDFFNSVGTFIMAEWLIEKGKPFKILISDTPVAGNYARGREIKTYLEGEGKPYFEKFIKSSAKVTDANNNGCTVFDISGARDLVEAFETVAMETIEMIVEPQKSHTGKREEVFSNLTENDINYAVQGI